MRRRLNARQKYILITWIKGHAADIAIQKLNSSIAHQYGNNQADLLADAASKMIALPDLFFQGHQLEKHIEIYLQAMFLACYNRRQTRRQ